MLDYVVLIYNAPTRRDFVWTLFLHPRRMKEKKHQENIHICELDVPRLANSA